VPSLVYSYSGCRNQTWNNRNLRWCVCNSSLCNGVSLEAMDRRAAARLAALTPPPPPPPYRRQPPAAAADKLKVSNSREFTQRVLNE